MERGALNKTNFFLTILVVLGSLALFNYLTGKLFVRIDLTEDKVFTVSDATRRILKNLDDPVIAKVFLSGKLPPQAVGMANRVRDLLSEFSKYSKGNLKIRYIDPTDDPDAESEARALGISPSQVTVIEKDKQQTVQVYLGIAFTFEDKSEAMMLGNNLGGFEYEVVSRIKKLTLDETPKIAFFFPDTERFGFSENLGNIKKVLDERYSVISTDLEEEPDASVRTLIIVGAGKMSEKQAVNLDQYLMKGGNIIALTEAVKVDTRFGMMGMPVDSRLFDMLSNYGVSVNKDLVLDASNAVLPFNAGNGRMFLSQYPFFVRVRPDGLNDENPVVSKLGSMLLPWVSSLTPVADSASGIESEVLISSTESAWLKTGRFDLMPEQDKIMSDRSSASKRVLGLVLSGEFPSYFKGKSLSDTVYQGAVLEKGVNSSIIAVGDSDFLTDEHTRESGNINFINNAVDMLSLDADLINIRSRHIKRAALDTDISAAKRNFIKYGNIYGIPLIIALLGLFVWQYRKKRFRTLREKRSQ
ncbi:MAG: GldG family protein [Fibrobacterota bacterium]